MHVSKKKSWLKKLVSLSLAAMMILGCLTTALAATPPDQWTEVTPSWLANKFRYSVTGDPQMRYFENPNHTPVNYDVERPLPSWVEKNERAPLFWTAEAYGSGAGGGSVAIMQCVDWLGNNLAEHGYEFAVLDGWMDAARGTSFPNEHGYTVYPYRDWQGTKTVSLIKGGSRVFTGGITFKDWGAFCRENGLGAGTYHTPLWLKRAYVYRPDEASNTSVAVDDASYNNPAYADRTVWNTGPGSEFQKKYPDLAAEFPEGLPLYKIIRRETMVEGLANDGTSVSSVSQKNYMNWDWYLVDPFKPGAEEYVKGLINYLRECGLSFIKCDFMRYLDENYGPQGVMLTMKWMREEAGEDFFVSLANQRGRNYAQYEAMYADMIRASEDQNSTPGWDRFADTNVGQIRPDQWRTAYGVVDGMNYWSGLTGPGHVITDGHQTVINRYTEVETETVVGLKVMGGSGIQISANLSALQAMQSSDGKSVRRVYTNPAMLGLVKEGFIAKPVKSYVSMLTPTQLAARNTDTRGSTGGNGANLTAAQYNDPLTQTWVGQAKNGDWVVGFFNRESAERTRSIKFADLALDGVSLGIDSAYQVRDLWKATADNPEGELIANAATEWTVTLPSRGCQIIRLSRASYVDLDKQELDLIINGDPELSTYKLSADVMILDGDSPKNTVTWKSSVPSVAEVDQNGNVTAKAVGKTTITATSDDDPTLSGTCEVTVYDAAQNPTGIVLSETSRTMNIGQAFTLTATVSPESVWDKSITWSSSDKNVATVIDGAVTAVGIGSADIVCTSNKLSSVTAKCTVTVEPGSAEYGDRIKITIAGGIPIPSLGNVYDDTSRSVVGMLPGKTQTLRAFVENADNKTVTWSSLDESVATVDQNGVVTMKGVGTTTILATSNQDPRFSAQILVYGASEDFVVEAEAGLEAIGDGTNIAAATANKEYSLGDGNKILRDNSTTVRKRSGNTMSGGGGIGNINDARGIDITYNAPEAGKYNVSVYYAQASGSAGPAASDKSRALTVQANGVPSSASDSWLLAQGTVNTATGFLHPEQEPVSYTVSLNEGGNLIRIRGGANPNYSNSNAPDVDKISITKAAGVIGAVANITGISNEGNKLQLTPTLITGDKQAVGTQYAYVDIYADGKLVESDREIETQTDAVYSMQSVGGITLNNGFVYKAEFPGVSAASIDKGDYEEPGVYTAAVRYGDVKSEPVYLFEIDPPPADPIIVVYAPTVSSTYTTAKNPTFETNRASNMSAATNQQGVNYIQDNNTSMPIGSWYSIEVEVPAAGSYKIEMSYKQGGSRAILDNYIGLKSLGDPALEPANKLNSINMRTTVAGGAREAPETGCTNTGMYLAQTLAESKHLAAGTHTFKNVVTTAGQYVPILLILTPVKAPVQKVAVPTADPVPGTYDSAQSVALSTATAGADIYYTTNGEDPTTDSAKYVSEINIAETTTIKAVAVKEGMTDSDVAEFEYIIDIPLEQAAAPTADPAPGTYNSVQTVILSTETEGADIYYTTDGEDPTAESIKYASGINIAETTTIKAIAVKEGMTDSEIAEFEYVIDIPVEVESVKIDGAAIQQVRIRNTKQFTATINPTDAADKSLTWESSNEKIFTVKDGLVTGLSTGSAKLIVTAANGTTSFIMVQITA